MSTAVQHRRGTKLQNDAFTGQEGEFTYNKTKKTIETHDGITLGGNALARQFDVNIKEYGARMNGVDDDTTFIQAAVDDMVDGQTLVIPAGAFVMRQVVFNSKNVNVFAVNSRAILSGDNAGFLVKGTITQFSVVGGKITGDNTSRDADASKAQIGWTFGNDPAANVRDVSIQNVVVEKTNVGFKVADGRGGGGTTTKNVRMSFCVAKNIVGTVGGVGYGFQFVQAPGGTLVGCLADTCPRHGIYFAEGRDYTASDCQITGGGIGGGSVRGCLGVSRSRNVSISNMVIHDNDDVAVVIDVDTQGLAPDNYVSDVAFTNLVLTDNTLGGYWIGTIDPQVSGLVKNVTITGGSIRPVAGSNNASVVINSGTAVKISGVQFNSGAAGASHRILKIAGCGTVPLTYNNHIHVRGNQFINSPSGISVQIENLHNVNSSVVITDNPGAEIEWVSGATAVTNTEYRTDLPVEVAITGATPNVGSANFFLMTQAGATNVTDLIGAYEGKTVTIRFGDSLSTMKNTNFFTADALDFLAQNQNMMVLRYQGGAWREVSRSVRVVDIDRTPETAINGATPSVVGANAFYLTNAGATNVTDFTGGVEGKTIIIRFGDGNSTVKATAIYLAGAVDFVGSNHDILVLKYISGAWREVSRSVN